MATEFASKIKSIRTEIAILVGAAVISAAIVAAACELKPSYVPNPAGGIWVEHSKVLFLCRMNVDKPATCISALTGKAIDYSDLLKQ